MDIGVYIGSGLDLEIANKLFHIKKLIFIDKKPNEINNGNDDEELNLFNFCNCFSKKDKKYIPKKYNFIKDLKKKLLEQGYILQKITSLSDCNGNKKERFLFKNKDQEIIYYVNVCIPKDIDIIENDIIDFNNLIVKKHNPDSIIFNYTENMLTFWGDNNVCYNTDYINKNNNNTVCYNLHHKYFSENFTKFNIIDNNKIVSVKTWDELLRITRNNCLKKKLIPLNK